MAGSPLSKIILKNSLSPKSKKTTIKLIFFLQILTLIPMLNIKALRLKHFVHLNIFLMHEQS
jgi:hypothetical protein